MSYRSATLYVQPKTLKRLRLVQKLYPQRAEAPSGASYEQQQGDKTQDELADQLLNESINTRFPLVAKLEQELANTEREFLKERGIK